MSSSREMRSHLPTRPQHDNTPAGPPALPPARRRGRFSLDSNWCEGEPPLLQKMVLFQAVINRKFLAEKLPSVHKENKSFVCLQRVICNNSFLVKMQLRAAWRARRVLDLDGAVSWGRMCWSKLLRTTALKCARLTRPKFTSTQERCQSNK